LIGDISPPRLTFFLWLHVGSNTPRRATCHDAAMLGAPNKFAPPCHRVCNRRRMSDTRRAALLRLDRRARLQMRKFHAHARRAARLTRCAEIAYFPSFSVWWRDTGAPRRPGTGADRDAATIARTEAGQRCFCRLAGLLSV